MASTAENSMKLISTTDGSAKCFKMAEGICMVLAGLSRIVNHNVAATVSRILSVSGTGDVEGTIKVVLSRENQYLHICRSLYTVRCFLRLGKFLRDFMKMHSLLKLVGAQGLYYTERKKYWECSRAFFSALFLILDNSLLLKQCLQPFHTTSLLQRLRVAAAPWEMVSADAPRRDTQWLLRYATTFRFGSYLSSLIMDALEMRDALLRLEYDPPAAKRAIKRHGVSLLRDVCDIAVTLPMLRALSHASTTGKVYRLYAPGSSSVRDGVLLCVSAWCSNWLTWQNVEKSLVP